VLSLLYDGEIKMCIKMAGTVARHKDNESDEVSWGEFWWMVTIGQCVIQKLEKILHHKSKGEDFSTLGWGSWCSLNRKTSSLVCLRNAP